MNRSTRYRPGSLTPMAVLALVCGLCGTPVHAQSPLDAYRDLARRLTAEGLRENATYDLLRELVTEAPHRLSGSPGAEKAVALTREMMERLGFERVRVETLMVPRWVRGQVEEAVVLKAGRRGALPLSVCALGGSVGTPRDGLTGKVVEVKSFDELKGLGDRARGKIVFFNRPMDPSLLHTFQAYGGAVDQRAEGAVHAARAGGIAAIVRSMTLARDDAPHTGSMNYAEDTPRIPALAVSTLDADMLSDLLKEEPALRIRIRLSCETLPDVPSGNVLGELTGTEKPGEVILIGGHLDAWDKGQGAHDDGGGCMQSIAALRLLKSLGLRPKRTIRAVMFMNEENGNRGGRAYADHPSRASEKHIAALESDRGSFAPRGFSIEADSATAALLARWAPLFSDLGVADFHRGGSGVDIGALVRTGIPGIGLVVENHRYFDVHHSANDVLTAVHPRELEIGTIAQALLCYILSEEGIPGPVR